MSLIHFEFWTSNPICNSFASGKFGWQSHYLSKWRKGRRVLNLIFALELLQTNFHIDNSDDFILMDYFLFFVKFSCIISKSTGWSVPNQSQSCSLNVLKSIHLCVMLVKVKRAILNRLYANYDNAKACLAHDIDVLSTQIDWHRCMRFNSFQWISLTTHTYIRT